MQGVRFFRAAAMAALLAGVAPAASAEEGAWAERVQIVYDAGSNSVARRKVRVWDAEPAKNLEFVWEPKQGGLPGIAADGTISGEGKLTWRIRGSASYDPKTVYSAYEGGMLDGRPHGRGRLEVRSGEVLEGVFAHGLLEGRGVRIAPDGSRYDGDFRGGRAAGMGRLALDTGEIYIGAFAAGLRHGRGLTTLPGGTAYESEWSMGRELGNRRDMVADATLGGLLKAQAGGGSAGKVEIGISIDERMNQESGMRYVRYVGENNMEIYPEDEAMNAAWRGDGEVSTADYYIAGLDWTHVPAFVGVDLRTTDGSRVKIEKLELQVKTSVAYPKPMLTLENHIGCVGFRPGFSIKNHGWGGAKNATLSLQFRGEAADAPASRVFPINVGDFADGIDVSIEGALQQAGVDTAKLAGERFSCQSRESLGVCRSQLFNSVGFGEVADHVWGEDKLFTNAVGRIDYDWADDFGNVYHQSEPFNVQIALATIELPEDTAECGDGFGGAPNPPRYQDVHFPLNQNDYVIDMPVRGNKNLREYQTRLKMYADKTSYHEFSVAAQFADGSLRQSKPVSFFFFKPNPSGFVSSARPAQCYLPASADGC